MSIRAVFTALFLSVAVTAQTLPLSAPVAPESDGVYQVRYIANLLVGESYVTVTNAGTLSGFDPAGRICVNVYTFDSNESLVSCCACLVTPNGVSTLTARGDLVSNTLTPGVPTSVTVKLVSSLPLGGTCNAASPAPNFLARGMRAWATTAHVNSTGGAVPYNMTTTPFAKAELSPSELEKLSGYCAFIQAIGSGFGICRSCRLGALGATTR